MTTPTPPRSEAFQFDRPASDEFAETLRGELVLPADRIFDHRRRIWNGSIDRYPSLIARCAGAADVIAAVRFARRHSLLVAVRGGGHSFPGHSVCDGGMVIDLSPMKGIRVDPAARTVRAQAGVLLGELDREAQAFGLAVPAGVVTHTGVAGLTLGGGLGWLVRHFGLTIDQLLSVDLITAEGEFVKASPAENADLFWGVRGGGGNFGIVSEFEFRAHPVGPQVLAGGVFWPIEETPKVLRFYREWIADAPDDLMTAVGQRLARPLPSIPVDLVGKRLVGILSCYSGSVEDGERILRPLKRFGAPVLDLCVPKPFLVHQASLDPMFRPGWWYYVRSCDVSGFSDSVIDVVADHGQRINTEVSALTVWQMGGAVAHVGEDETAFNGRDAAFTFNITGGTEGRDGFEEQRAWARDYWSALAPHHTGVYVNFLMEEGEERIRQAYGAAKYARLRTLKRKYDPENFFRLNQNIAPL
ncbi:MAG: FAD-binding oxidoreductase [Actinomycetota bacterium]